MDPQLELDSILIALRGASLEEQAEIGRGDLASLLHVAPPQLVDKIIKMARRDNRVRNALAASRYYCGLGKSICDKIDFGGERAVSGGASAQAETVLQALAIDPAFQFRPRNQTRPRRTT